MLERFLQQGYLIGDLVKWETKEKEETRNKMYRDTDLTGEPNGDKDKKQTWSVMVTDVLLRNCRQTGTS